MSGLFGPGIDGSQHILIKNQTSIWCTPAIGCPNAANCSSFAEFIRARKWLMPVSSGKTGLSWTVFRTIRQTRVMSNAFCRRNFGYMNYDVHLSLCRQWMWKGRRYRTYGIITLILYLKSSDWSESFRITECPIGSIVKWFWPSAQASAQTSNMSATRLMTRPQI